MAEPLYFAALLVNMTCRVVVFTFFWWAYQTDGFDDYNYGFQAYIDAWQEVSLTNIISISDSKQCDEDTQILLTQYYLNTITAFEEYNEIKAEELQVWGTTGSNIGFKLCGILGTHNYLPTAHTPGNCSSKAMKECTVGQGSSFCVGSNDTCPIFGFSIQANGTIIILTNKSTQVLNGRLQMPLSRVRIGTNGICYESNNGNIDLNEAYDPKLIKYLKETGCITIDDSYIEVNSISDSQYYKLNGVTLAINDTTIEKTLYYRQYPIWNPKCYGELFNLTFTIRDQLIETIQLSTDGYYASVIDLLLLCYIFPGIPFMCRCIESLRLDRLLVVDSILRLVLIGIMTTYSFKIISLSKDLTTNIQTIINNDCSPDKANLVSQEEFITSNITTQNTVAVYIAIALTTIELIIATLLICGNWCQKILTYIRRYRTNQSVKEHDYSLTHAYETEYGVYQNEIEQ